MIVSGNEIKKNSCINADICIVGAGAAGITLGSALLGTKLKVIIIESGGIENNPSAQELNETTSSYLPIGDDARVRVFGGTTADWAGKWIPFIASDFEVKGWLPNSGWPISFKDLFPYFQKATQLHGGPSLEQTKGYFNNPPKILGDNTENPKLVQTPIYWLNNSKIKFADNVGKQLVEDKDLTIHTMSTVVNILTTSDNKSVSQLKISTLDGNHFYIKPRATILAGGGIENARCLLASNKNAPAGIGNENDAVGRYFMDHPKGILASIKLSKDQSFPKCFDFNPNHNGRVDLGLRLSDADMESLGALNTYLLLNPMFPWSENKILPQLLSAILGLKQNFTDTRQWKTIIKLLLQVNKKALSQYVVSKVASVLFKKQPIPERIDVQFHMEQAPDKANRVTLSDKMDQFGYPLPHVNWKLSTAEKSTVLNLYSVLENWLTVNNVGSLDWHRSVAEEDDWDWIDDASHHSGTTRMGDDPKTSVVDKNCKVHSVDNLYIAGSSVFPTSGFSNPTWTIAALSLLLADHLKGKFKCD